MAGAVLSRGPVVAGRAVQAVQLPERRAVADRGGRREAERGPLAVSRRTESRATSCCSGGCRSRRRSATTTSRRSLAAPRPRFASRQRARSSPARPDPARLPATATRRASTPPAKACTWSWASSRRSRRRRLHAGRAVVPGHPRHGLDGYYQQPGGVNDFLGYVSAGVQVTVPLDAPGPLRQVVPQRLLHLPPPPRRQRQVRQRRRRARVHRHGRHQLLY